MTEDMAESLIGAAEYFAKHNIIFPNECKNPECNHYFIKGYTMEPIYYCQKCNKEIDEIYSNKDVQYMLQKCSLINGKFLDAYNK